MSRASGYLVSFAIRVARTGLLLLLVALGTLALIRYAPGYFSDSREMDAQFASTVEAELSARRSEDRSVLTMAAKTLAELRHGDLGTSRHYHVSVAELIWPTLPVTAALIAKSLLLGWSVAFAAAIPASLARRRYARLATSLLTSVLIAIPIGALATVLIVWGTGGQAGPVIALGGVLAARDFSFFVRALGSANQAPHLLYARAQGLGPVRRVVTHLLRPALPQCGALLGLSWLTALSLVVPVEVLFSQPGLGQLAWTAAMNRDTPVLLAATLLMAGAVSLTRLFGPVHGAVREEYA